MSETRKWKVGTHTFFFEPPDLMRLDYRGEITLADVTSLIQIFAEVTRTGTVYLIGDMSNAPQLKPEVQQYFGENLRTEWFRALIFFGVRLHHKAAVKGVILATKLPTNEVAAAEEVMTRTHYVATREDAEQLLRKLRAQNDYSPEG